MTTIIKVDPEDPSLIESPSSRHSERRGVIAFPTETFYGLGADAGNEKPSNKYSGSRP